MLQKLSLAASALAMATAAPAAAQDASGPALWRVADEDTTIYLFGTVHVLPQDVEWLQPTVRNALAESDQYVSEIDTSEIPDFDPTSGEAPPPEIIAIAQMTMQLAALEGEESLRDLMTEDDRAQYEAAMADLGLPVNAFDQFEPWFASINMMQMAMMKAGYDPNDGVEMVLDTMVEGKDRVAFETVEQQMGFFDSMPLQSQLDFLDQGIEEWNDMGAVEGVFQQMVDEWVAGDADGLASIVNEQMEDPLVYDILLTQRNSAWAAWLDDRMDQPGTVFVAVGAGHLGGENSVQDFLAERGLTVERVEY